jgi:hypothetical protein
VVLPPHLQRQAQRQRLPRLLDALFPGIDLAGEDQRLRPGPAFGQPPIDQRLVGAFPGDGG